MTKVHITGLSQKADEFRTLHLMRENRKTLPHQHPMDERPKPRFAGGGIKRPIRPGQAGPVTYQGKGTYHFGDGDVIQAVRPGADDHMKFKSLGLGAGEAQYHNRGHV